MCFVCCRFYLLFTCQINNVTFSCQFRESVQYFFIIIIILLLLYCTWVTYSPKYTKYTYFPHKPFILELKLAKFEQSFSNLRNFKYNSLSTISCFVCMCQPIRLLNLDSINWGRHSQLGLPKPLSTWNHSHEMLHLFYTLPTVHTETSYSIVDTSTCLSLQEKQQKKKKQ